MAGPSVISPYRLSKTTLITNKIIRAPEYRITFISSFKSPFHIITLAVITLAVHHASSHHVGSHHVGSHHASSHHASLITLAVITLTVITLAVIKQAVIWSRKICVIKDFHFVLFCKSLWHVLSVFIVCILIFLNVIKIKLATDTTYPQLVEHIKSYKLKFIIQNYVIITCLIDTRKKILHQLDSKLKLKNGMWLIRKQKCTITYCEIVYL